MPFPAAQVGLPESVCIGFPVAPLGFGTILTGAPTVLVGKSALPAAFVGSMIKPHGNPVNPKMPGFNMVCAAATIIIGSPTVLVSGLPMARITSKCSCGQHSVGLGEPTVLVGP